MVWVARIVLGLMALYCAGQAVAVWANPDGIATAIHLALTDASGRAEFMTIYGGFFLGLGVFFGLGALSPRFREAGLVLLTLSMVATAATRALLIATTPTDPVSTVTLWFEIGFAAAGAVGWWAHGRDRDREA